MWCRTRFPMRAVLRLFNAQATFGAWDRTLSRWSCTLPHYYDWYLLFSEDKLLENCIPRTSCGTTALAAMWVHLLNR
jgi:hypothetical protein